ncbi:MAG: PfkB family carbohydrate kinase [Chromatiales bacterium]|jgi:ketohexokinase|nr:PfkB family carbohydrate kinase [Chromatiales bacterium]MDX9766295.1 PfkB family carbohydrate kinase [Ectothiorhodospiraceae bacterium]
MSHILGIGIATLDRVFVVERFPTEDAEMRALDHRARPGGNAANSLGVLAQLGHRCDLLAVLAAGADGARIGEALAARGIDSSACPRRPGAAPTSCVLLAQDTGSRTIVHHRDLPELDFEDFARLPIERYDWLHFEGRNVAVTRRMLQQARRRLTDQPLSLEVEKEREDIDTLLPLADVLMFSAAFARGRGFDDPATFLPAMRRRAPRAILTCTWGEAGAWALSADDRSLHAPAFAPPAVVDTLGAGDCFNAGLIDALISGRTLDEALDRACRLAGRKVGQMGLDGLTDPPSTRA